MIHQIKLWMEPILDKCRDLRTLGILDSAHAAGLTHNTFLSAFLGAENHLTSPRDVETLMRKIEHLRISFLLGVPPVFSRMVVHPSFAHSDLSSLQFVTSGAARTDEVDQMAMNRKLPRNVSCQQAWGMTEVTLAATMHLPGILGPLDSVGKLLLGVRAKVCNENGQIAHSLPRKVKEWQAHPGLKSWRTVYDGHAP
jgi:acyl-CoA synthetase (AMP-forming)/AMP-acid ligase II